MRPKPTASRTPSSRQRLEVRAGPVVVKADGALALVVLVLILVLLVIGAGSPAVEGIWKRISSAVGWSAARIEEALPDTTDGALR